MGNPVSITVSQQHDYQFLVDFGAPIPPLLADEHAPLGAGKGPSPTEPLLASVANCLTASLFFALRKFKQDAGGEIGQLDRILSQFEAFCTVSQSVRQGIPIVVNVMNGAGVRVT